MQSALTVSERFGGGRSQCPFRRNGVAVGIDPPDGWREETVLLWMTKADDDV
jgi:hypothetical protein